MMSGARKTAWCALFAAALAGGAARPPAAAVQEKDAERPAARQKPAAAGARLRAQWKLGDLKLTREAVEAASFAPDIKKAAIAAVDWFIARQEALLKDVEASPERAAEASRSRAALEAKYRQRMAMIYDDPALLAELSRRLKALDRELDAMAESADRMFEKLEAAELTPEQREKIRPVVRQASDEIKRTVAESARRSVKDDDVRDEVVSKYRDARRKVQQHLTPAQKARLARKLAED